MTQAYLSIEHIEISLADTDTTDTVNISAGDTTKCTPLYTYRVGNTDESDSGADFIEIDFLTGPNRIRVTRSVGDGTMTIRIAVIEWDTTLVDIQSGTFAIINNETIDDITISAVTLAKTFMVLSYQRESGTTEPIGNLVQAMIDSTTNAHFQRGGGGGEGQIDGRFWTIEDTDTGLWDVESIEAGVASTTSDDFTIASVDEDKTFLIGSDRMVGGGNRAESVGIAQLFSATVVRYTRPDDFRDMQLDMFVVELLQSGDSVQRGALTLGSGTETDTAVLTAIVVDESFPNAPTRVSTATVDVDTYETALRGLIQLNSTTELEVSTADNSTVSIMNWEVVSLETDAAGTTVPALFFGLDF